MTPAVSAKLSVSVGSRRSVISPESTPFAGEAAANPAQCRVARLRCGPRVLDELAHRTGGAEQLSAPADAEPHAGEIRTST